jgi:hypothetical protein
MVPVGRNILPCQQFELMRAPSELLQATTLLIYILRIHGSTGTVATETKVFCIFSSAPPGKYGDSKSKAISVIGREDP